MLRRPRQQELGRLVYPRAEYAAQSMVLTVDDEDGRRSPFSVEPGAGVLLPVRTQADDWDVDATSPRRSTRSAP